MRDIGRYWVHGSRLLAASVVATVMAGAAAAGEPPVILASLYGGSDLNGGQSAWPPHGTPKTGIVQPLPLGGDEITPIPASPPARTPTLQPPDLQAAQNVRGNGYGLSDILSEVRMGLLAHDVGVFENSREDGIDLSLEVYFVSPAVLEAIWSPRPHIGIAINTAGDTSQLYGGLVWDWPFWKPFFVEGALALAVHDGKLDGPAPGRKALGCRVLFRESVALGARFLERHTVALQFAHVSNAGLCTENGGLDTFGVQYGYRF